MPKDVRCTVEECKYNDNQDCTAREILVQSNGNDIVGTEKGTLCATFEYRDFDDARASERDTQHTNQDYRH
jgi:hypothetical protein